MPAKAQLLVAEDEAMLRELAVETLQDAGFEVFEAGDGVAALALLQANPAIALLVSDIRMPWMNGHALVEAGIAINPRLKILLMTGYAEELPHAHALRARDIKILHKPFDLDVLCRLATAMVTSPAS